MMSVSILNDVLDHEVLLTVVKYLVMNAAFSNYLTDHFQPVKLYGATLTLY